MAELLHLYYGSGTLPTRSTVTNGNLYVLTTNTIVDNSNSSDPIKSATFYTDLGGVRYRVDAAAANKLNNSLSLQLAGNAMNPASFDGSVATVWNIPAADGNTIGIVSAAAQTFNGDKTFAGTIKATKGVAASTISIITGTTSSAAGSIAMEPAKTNVMDIGTSSLKYRNIYATTFNGALSGKATTAGTADKVANSLTIGTDGTVANATYTYNGSAATHVNLKTLLDALNVPYLVNGVLPLSNIPKGAIERFVGTYADNAAALAKVNDGTLQIGDMFKIGNTMYYVTADKYKADGTGIDTSKANFTTVASFAQEFSVGTATVADHTVASLKMQIMGVDKATFNGSTATTFNVPAATTSVAGVVSLDTQSFKGDKTFEGAVTIGTSSTNKNLTVNGAISTTGSGSFGGTVTATGGFIGDVTGNASSATVADHLANALEITYNGTKYTYTGASAVSFSIPAASTSVAGVVTTGAQSFAGAKTFTGAVTVQGTIKTGKSDSTSGTVAMQPEKTNVMNIGTSSLKYATIYATTFNGEATSAAKVKAALSFNTNGAGITASSYDGSTATALSTFKGATASANGVYGFVPAPASGQQGYFLRGDGSWRSITSGNTSITISDSSSNMVITHATSVSAARTAYTVGDTAKLNAGSRNMTITNGQKSYTDTVDGTVINLFDAKYNTTGHITESTSVAKTIGYVDVNTTFSTGDIYATVLGVDVRGGLEWNTF